MSIDVARRVRQLSHTLQGQICQCSGKRIARVMPNLVGAWVAGLQDPDRTVSRSAEEAFQSVFSTAEKQSNVLKVYQQQIIEFARDALLNESEKTLSDERSTSAEDADAKFQRLVASAIAVINELLTKVPESELHKQHEAYDEVLTNNKFWDFTSSKDASVRRFLFRLLRTCLDTRPGMLSNSGI